MEEGEAAENTSQAGIEGEVLSDEEQGEFDANMDEEAEEMCVITEFHL